MTEGTNEAPLVVFQTGRRIEAEVVRSMLEGSGIRALVSTSGIGNWHEGGAITEITGIPSAVNAHTVIVPAEDADVARRLIAAADDTS